MSSQRRIGIFAFAGLVSGGGAIVGTALGASDSFSDTQAALAVLGMVLVSGACAWLVQRPARKHFIASLPFFWFTIGFSLIALLVAGKDNQIALPIAAVLGVATGRAVGDLLLKHLNGRDAETINVETTHIQRCVQLCPLGAEVGIAQRAKCRKSRAAARFEKCPR